MPLNPSTCLELLARAQQEPLGLVLRTSPGGYAHIQAQIYKAMADAGYTTEELGLIINRPDIPDTLFITQRSVELDP